MQICLSKDTYDMLALYGIQSNVKVYGTYSFLQSQVKEIVYELLARHKAKLTQRPLARYTTSLPKSNQADIAVNKMGEKNA